MTIIHDYAVSPGDHIEEWLDDQDINAAELARRLDARILHTGDHGMLLTKRQEPNWLLPCCLSEMGVSGC